MASIELRRHAHPLAFAADAALEHVAHAELLADRAHVDVAALKANAEVRAATRRPGSLARSLESSSLRPSPR